MKEMNLQRISCLSLLSAMIMTFGCKSIPENGKLPTDYSWAYGVWQIEEKQEDYHRETTVLVGGDYLQFGSDADDFRKVVPNLGEFYPIYTFPKTPFYLSGEPNFEGDSDGSPDELVLGYYDCAGYPSLLFLNKKKKSVSSFSESSRKQGGISSSCRKLNIKTDESVICSYNAELEALPFYGDWKNVSRSRDKIKIEPGRNDYILTKNGHLIELPGIVYEYDATDDRITLYEHYDDIHEVRHYKRFDPVKEKQEELTALIANRTFSIMGEPIPFVNNSLGTRFVLSFASDGTGVSSFYNINLIMDYELKSRHVFTWRIDNENLVTKNLAGDNDTDYFKIQSNVFGTALVDGSGKSYTLD